MRGSAQQNSEEFATRMALRATARRALACEGEAQQLTAEIDRLVRRIAGHLLERTGVGPIVAAHLLMSWSHP
jgi:hypothetical protein